MTRRLTFIATVTLVACVASQGVLPSSSAPPSDATCLIINNEVAYQTGVDPCTIGAPTSTTSPPTSQPATTTTLPTTTSTSSPPTTSPVSSTSTTSPATSTTSVPTTTTSPPGQFVETFTNTLVGWIFAQGRASTSDDGQTQATVGIVSGALRIVNGQQNYGDATMRSTVPYNLTGGGTVELDITDNGAGNPLIGSAYIMFSAGPQDGRLQHHTGIRSTPYGTNIPTEGVTVWLQDNCRVPWAPPVVVTYPAMSVQQGNCGATPDGRLRLVYTPGHLSIRNGAGAEIVAYNVTLPATGYVTLGVHNHASLKYSTPVNSQAAVTGVFDNITYPS